MGSALSVNREARAYHSTLTKVYWLISICRGSDGEPVPALALPARSYVRRSSGCPALGRPRYSTDLRGRASSPPFPQSVRFSRVRAFSPHELRVSGFNVESVQHEDTVFTLWDVGGGYKIHELWHHCQWQDASATLSTLMRDCRHARR
jgi:hypothetical protein